MDCFSEQQRPYFHLVQDVSTFPTAVQLSRVKLSITGAAQCLGLTLTCHRVSNFVPSGIEYFPDLSWTMR